jgi:hypothetical protein
MANCEPTESLSELVSRQDTTIKSLKTLQKDITRLLEGRPKDKWDKFAMICTFISTVLIAGAALIVTILYNRETLQGGADELVIARTITKVMVDLKAKELLIGTRAAVAQYEPALARGGDARQFAIINISSLDPRLANQLAINYRDVPSIDALSAIVNVGDERAEASTAALTQIARAGKDDDPQLRAIQKLRLIFPLTCSTAAECSFTPTQSRIYTLMATATATPVGFDSMLLHLTFQQNSQPPSDCPPLDPHNPPPVAEPYSGSAGTFLVSCDAALEGGQPYTLHLGTTTRANPTLNYAIGIPTPTR